MAKASKDKLLSLRAYARHRAELGLPGKSLSSVQRALAAGRIPVVKRKSRGKLVVYIDPNAADAAWQANTRGKADKPAAAPGAELPAGGSDYQRHRADKEEVELELRRLKLAELRGQLVIREAVEREAAAIARRVRDRVLTIPARTAAMLRAELKVDTTDRAIETLMDAELRDVLRELAGEIGGGNGSG